VSHRLQVLASSFATMAVMAIVVGMVGIYVTSAVGVLCVLGGGLIMVWINHALLTRVEDGEARLRTLLDTSIVEDISPRQAVEEHLQHLIEQLTASSKALEAMMTAQVTSTNQIVASAQQIAATSQELVQTMQGVTGMAADTATAAEGGQTGLARMQATMQTMEGATRTIADRLAVINERAANITSVVTTISRVAEQTNLLSLNAAIEAEKAGQYGRGFAVVAREIRRLADQTAEATLDIEHIVQEMTSAISAGVVGMDQFAHEVRQGAEAVRTVAAQLAQIISAVQMLTPRFNAVHEGMQAQAQRAQQINAAMVQLRDAAQRTMDSAHASTRAMAQLSEVSQSLHDGRGRVTEESVGR